MAEQSIAAAKTLDNIRQILAIVVFGNPPAGIDPSNSISRLAEPVKKLQRAPTESCVTETTRQAILKSYHVLDTMCVAEPPFARAMGGFQDTTPVLLEELEQALSTHIRDADSVMQMTVSDVVKELRAKVSRVT